MRPLQANTRVVLRGTRLAKYAASVRETVESLGIKVA